MSVRRFRIALLAGLLGALLLPALPAAAAAAPSPWLQAGHDAAASNANPAETALTPRTVGRAGVERTLAPTGHDCYGYRARLSAPLLSESRVYVVSGTTLLAYDAASGAVLWQQALAPDDALVPVAVSHGLVVLGGNDCGSVSDPLGQVRAYRSTDGSPAWTLALPYADALSDVSVSDKYVVARTGFQADEVDLSVFRVQDGRAVWSQTGLVNDSGLQDASARVVAGHVYTTGFDGTGYPQLEVRSLATGAVESTALPVTVERGDSDTAGTHLYVQSGGAVFDADPATGTLRFVLPAATRSLAVDGTRVYADCATDGSIVCAYAADTGRRVWARGVKGQGVGAVAAGGLLYLSSGQVLNAATGKLVRTVAGDPIAVGQGRVAVLRPSGGVSLYGLPAA